MQTVRLTVTLAMSLSCSWLSFYAPPIKADDGSCCHHCGCQSSCKKVCRLVCETKKVKEPCYSCECEDFCLPGPSKCCGHRVVCEPCGKTHKEKIWQPSCGCVKTRKKLVKTEIEKEVCVYKCEVVYLCNRCCQDCDSCQEAAAAQPAEQPAAQSDSQPDSTLVPDPQVAMEPQPEAPQPGFFSRLIGR